MYQVTLFDAQGAIVQIEQFTNHEQAMLYMVNVALGVGEKMHQVKGATHWQLSDLFGKRGLVPHQ